MSTIQSTVTVTATVVGLWSTSPTTSASHLDLEAQVVHGHREPLSLTTSAARAHFPRAQLASPYEKIDPNDDFFGVVRGTQDSRHDDYRFSIHFENDVPPPPYVDANGLPSYASVTGPSTLTMYLFKFGFLFPMFWLAGVAILLRPLYTPEDWESIKIDLERKELLECLRQTEAKWARRCLIAFSAFSILVTAIAVLTILGRRG